jgi:hypothetical protein
MLDRIVFLHAVTEGGASKNFRLMTEATDAIEMAEQKHQLTRYLQYR